MENTLFTELSLSEQASLAGGWYFSYPTFSSSNTNTNNNTAQAAVVNSGNSRSAITIGNIDLGGGDFPGEGDPVDGV